MTRVKTNKRALLRKAAALSEKANECMAQNDWDAAEQNALQSLEIAQELGDLYWIALNKTKLGQAAQARLEFPQALACYREAFSLFEQVDAALEMDQVRRLIAQVEGGAPDPLRLAVARARQAQQNGDFAAAVTFQAQAVLLARQREQTPDVLTTLSVLLYNLAGYYSQAGQLTEAVNALEEVVALDEHTAHPDLEADRQALDAARHLAALPPDEHARIQSLAQAQPAAPPGSAVVPEIVQQQITAHLSALPFEQRRRLEIALHDFAEMSPEQQAALLETAQQLQITDLATQARQAAIAVRLGLAPATEVIPQLTEVAGQASMNEAPGSPWQQFAQYLYVVVALLQGAPLPPVPEAYAAHLAAIQQAGQESSRGLQE